MHEENLSVTSTQPQITVADVTSSNALGIWLVRAQAEPLGNHIKERLAGGGMVGELLCPWLQDNVSHQELFRQTFRKYRQWLLIMPAGMAVRFLNGLTGDKTTDPGVVVLDEGCHHVISLLGGHEGGANKLAYRIANLIGANPVITTASESLKPLTLGIGCRQGVSAQQVEACVLKALQNRSLAEVRQVATIDLKARESGLLSFCEKHDLPLRILATSDIAQRAWTKNASAWVQKHIGIAGVCEPCALMASIKGVLIRPKTTLDGVAVAVVEDVEKFR